MYIAGKEISSKGSIDVIDPFTNDVIAQVPAATKDQVSEAFRIGASYNAKLSRYERQQYYKRLQNYLSRTKRVIRHYN